MLAVEAVLFDLDGTLYDLRALRRRLLLQAPGQVARFGPLGLLRRVRVLQAFRRAREAHRGSPRVESLLEVLAARVAGELGVEVAWVRQAVRDFFFDSEFRELEGLSPPGDRAVLAELHSRGYALGVLSEYPVERKLRALGLHDLPWQAGISCEEVGALKPDPAPFLEAARRLGLAPPRVLVVGDRRDADVAGAAAAGMPSAWLASRDPRHGDGPPPELTLTCLADLLAHLPPRRLARG